MTMIINNAEKLAIGQLARAPDTINPTATTSTEKASNGNNIIDNGLKLYAMPADTKQQATASPSLEEIGAAVQEIEDSLNFMQTKIAVKFDPDSHEGIMQVIDKETGRILRQVPPEEILKIRKAFREMVRGLFLNETA